MKKMFTIPTKMFALLLATLFFCLDGGGSKTLLQVIDDQGSLIASAEGPPSNPNTLAWETLKKDLYTLFDRLEINGQSSLTLLPTSQLIAGMAGLSSFENHATMTSFFQELGARDPLVFTDAELALHLLDGDGLILIAGTGSICLAKTQGRIHRIGGLGPLLGDEGSGYRLGLFALRSALADELGYGPPTSLTTALRAHFCLSELKSLLPLLKTLPPSTIAGLAPLVMQAAQAKDPIALTLLEQTALELKELLATALHTTHLSHCPLHLYGGLFKSPFAPLFIHALAEEAASTSLNLVNHSSTNPALLYALRSIKLVPVSFSSKKRAQ